MKSERRVGRKKEQILLSAIKIVNKKGFDQTTMEQISAQLHMTKGALYYYFKNKEDLLCQCHHLIMSQAIEELHQIMNKVNSAENIIRKMIETHIDYALKEQEFFNLVLLEPTKVFHEEHLQSVLHLRKQYASLFDLVIAKGIENGEFHVKEPFVARMIILGALNWIQQWFKTEGVLSKDDIKKHFGDYVLKLLK